MTDMVVTGEIHDWGHYTMRGKTFVCGNIHKDIQGRFPDGKWVQTSYLTAVDGDLISTRSGSVYRLIGPPKSGDPLPAIAPETSNNQ